MVRIRGGGRVPATTAATLMLLAAQLLPGTAMTQHADGSTTVGGSLESVDTCDRESLALRRL